VLAQIKTLVRSVNDDRVFGQALGIQKIQDPPDVVVDGGNAAEIIADIALIFPLRQRPALEAGPVRVGQRLGSFLS